MKANPMAKIKVYKTTFLLSLNMVPKYEGKRNVIQQGANNANTPARNEAVKEIPNKKLVFMFILHKI